MIQDKVSILIRTFNEGSHILPCSELIFNQTYKNFEIIFVDSGSTDNTISQIKLLQEKNTNVKLVAISKEEFSYGKALNIGIKSSLYDSTYIVLLSAHAYPTSNKWLENFVNYIQKDSTIAGVFGKQQPFESHLTNWIVRYQNNGGYQSFYKNHSFITTESYHFSNANAIINKSVWQVIPYDEDLPYTEDWLWAKECLQKGYKLGYCSTASVYHSHPDSLLQYLKRRKNEILGTNKVIPNTYRKVHFKSLIQNLGIEIIKNFPTNVKKNGLTNGFIFTLIKMLDQLIIYKNT